MRGKRRTLSSSPYKTLTNKKNKPKQPEAEGYLDSPLTRSHALMLSLKVLISLVVSLFTLM